MTDPAERGRRLVVALGGNALLRRGEEPSAEVQRQNLRQAAAVLADLARQGDLVVTHGNGPQVGLLARQSESGEGLPLPLDVLGAQTQGMIGYLIEDELRDRLAGEREVATLLTQVVVDTRDPAFDRPTKPIGAVHGKAEAERLAARYGWSIAPDPAGGEHWRRVVPSPEPIRVLEQRSIELLLDAGVVVVCAGGGGVPVVADPAGGWRGVEAVVDKDLSTALLADRIGAHALLLLTDVDAVYRDWGEASARPIREETAAALRRERFAPGTMGPKVEAACRFVEGAEEGGGEGTSGRRFAAIGALEDAAGILRGDTGTRVVAAR